MTRFPPFPARFYSFPRNFAFHQDLFIIKCRNNRNSVSESPPQPPARNTPRSAYGVRIFRFRTGTTAANRQKYQGANARSVHPSFLRHQPQSSVSFRLLRFDGVLVGLDHLLRRDTRTTSTPCIELFKPFFGAFARKYLNFKLRCIIIC